MTFYQKLDMLCKNQGTTVTALAVELGFSNSAGTTWKKSKGLPRNSTLKKIADYFNISVEELESGIEMPTDYSKVDTSSFRQDVYAHFLEKCNGNEIAAIEAYLSFEKTEAEDAIKDRANYIQDNHGIIGTTHAPVAIMNDTNCLSEQETELVNLFRKLSVLKQSQLIVKAAEMLENEGKG